LAPSPDPSALHPEFLRRLEQLRLVARRQHGGRFAALQRSKKLGRGMDFADHRPYAPGDDWKDIDWTLYGRLDRLMVKLAEEETELNLYLLVDVSGSMAEPGKSSFARQVATALAYVALASLDRVHLVPFGASMRPMFSPSRSRAQAVQVYRRLEAEASDGEGTDFIASMRSFAGLVRGRGIALVLSDFLADSGWQGALDRLRHARFEVGVLHISAPEEHGVPARGDVLLRDREGARLRFRMREDIGAAYLRAMREHGEALAAYARAHGLFHAHARTDQPFDEVVLRTMRTERLLA
jgi:uncharacterized protein (DUF58 family)